MRRAVALPTSSSTSIITVLAASIRLETTNEQVGATNALGENRSDKTTLNDLPFRHDHGPIYIDRIRKE